MLIIVKDLSRPLLRFFVSWPHRSWILRASVRKNISIQRSISGTQLTRDRTQHASERNSRYDDLQQIKRLMECIQVKRVVAHGMFWMRTLFWIKTIRTHIDIRDFCSQMLQVIKRKLKVWSCSQMKPFGLLRCGFISVIRTCQKSGLKFCCFKKNLFFFSHKSQANFKITGANF